MRKTYSLESNEETEQLNALLKPFGIHIDKEEKTFTADLKYLDQMRRRNAGRPYAVLRENGYLAHVTKGEIKTRMKEENAEQIAASLGISRRTLFRRLAECDSDEDELL